MKNLFCIVLLALYACTPWQSGQAYNPGAPQPTPPSTFARALYSPLPISWRVPVVRVSRGWPGGVAIVEAYDSPFYCHGMAWAPKDKNIPVGGQVTFSPTGVPCTDQNAEIYITTLPPEYGLNDVTCAAAFIGEKFTVLATTPTLTNCIWKADPLGGYDVQYNLVKPSNDSVKF